MKTSPMIINKINPYVLCRLVLFVELFGHFRFETTLSKFNLVLKVFEPTNKITRLG